MPTWTLFAADVRPFKAPLVLFAFAGIAVLLGVIYQTGLLGIILRVVFGVAVRCVRAGYRTWDRWLSLLPWYGLAGILVGVHLLRWPFDMPPLITALFGAILLTIGAITVLAFMFIDTERYEVSRGYKALHSPVKGQRLAEGLARYGESVGYALLITAILCCVCGFSLMNLGLADSIGQDWYGYGTYPSHEQIGVVERILRGEHKQTDSYADFLVYTLINLAYLVDLLDLFNKSGESRIAFVRPAAWQASVLLASFRLFFSFVLLQQVVSLVRHGRLLGESVLDLWSPYEPIQRRAADHLRQQGPDAVPVVLGSVELLSPLTAEQRELVPRVLAEIGPASVPILSNSLRHPNDDVRAVAIAALGHLQAWWALPELASAAEDGSMEVRVALATALEEIGGIGVPLIRKQWALGRASPPRRLWLRLLRRPNPIAIRSAGQDPVELCVMTLRALLRDPERDVRLRAAHAVQVFGEEAATALPEVLALGREEDDELRATAAAVLGYVKGPVEQTRAALVALLEPPVPAVLVPALRSLGELKSEASATIERIIPLLQHVDEAVRTAAAEALNQIGHLGTTATPELVEALSSPDDLERARAVEGLGTIGPPAAATAPALVKALGDNNDRVRALAAWALGRLGPEAAIESVPALARALRDQDSNVAVKAAEALGALGEVSGAAQPELREALRHINAEVRRHAAAAVGFIGGVEPADVRALEPLLRDEDSTVRRQVVLTLGAVREDNTRIEALLLRALEDEDPEVRAAGVSVLGQPAPASLVLNALLHCLEDASAPVKAEAARALGKLAQAPPRVIEALSGLLVEQPDEVKLAAAAALGQLGAQARAVAPQLLALIETGTTGLREQALRSLVQIEPADGFAVFAEALKDPEPGVRRLASAGLLKLKDLPPEVILLLPDGLSDPDVQVCSNMAHVCSRLEILPQELVPLLLGHMASPDDGLRLNALRALQNVPVAGGEPLLARLLEDPNQRIAIQAAAVLLSHDANAAGIEDVLARGLEAGTVYRDQALRALADADPALPGLRELLDRLSERVSDGGTRAQLARLQARQNAEPSPAA